MMLPSDTSIQKWLIAALGLCLAAVYVYALCGPLKMAGDSPGYVELAGYLLHGTPARTVAAPGYPYYFPHGYPYVLIGLDAVGLANAAGIIGVNVACAGIGLYFSWLIITKRIGLSSAAAFCAVASAAAAAAFFQVVVCPVPEMSYFATSMASVYCLSRARESLAALAVGCALAIAAIFVRTVGTALIPAAVMALIGQPRIRQWMTAGRLARGAILGGVLASFLISSVWDNHYLRTTVPHGIERIRNGDWTAAVYKKVSHFGEIATNLRATDYPLKYRPEFALVGSLVIAVCLCGLWSRRHRLGIADAYIVAYCLMVAVYPFWQKRLWAPVLPFLFAYGGLGIQWLLRESSRWQLAAKRAGLAYCVAFVALGCVLAVNFSRSAVYPDVDDAINTNRRAEPHLAALRGEQ